MTKSKIGKSKSTFKSLEVEKIEKVEKTGPAGFGKIEGAFCKIISKNLSTLLNSEILLTLKSSSEALLSKIDPSLESCFLVVFFELRPLPYRIILTINERMVRTLLAISLGGSQEHAEKNDHELTASEIEKKVIKNYIANILASIESVWTKQYPIELKSTSLHLMDGVSYTSIPAVPVRSTQIIGGAESEMELKIITPLALPARLIEHFGDRNKIESPFSSERAQAKLGALEVEVSVQLGEATLSVEDLLELTPGDVIQLNSGPSETLDILVNGKKKFKGKVGVRNGKSAVEIVKRD